MGDDLYNSKL